MMGYGDEFGDVEFRKAIVQMANHQRGMQASEHEVCITREVRWQCTSLHIPYLKRKTM